MEVFGEVRIRFGHSVEGRLSGSIPIHWKVKTGTPCNGATKFVPIWNRDFSPVDTCKHTLRRRPRPPEDFTVAGVTNLVS